MANTQSEKRREGAEGGGAHQEGRSSEQAGQTNRRAYGDNQKHEKAQRDRAATGDGVEQGRHGRETGGDTGRQHENDHQKTVQGKNQKGPDDKVGRDVGGGNAGSKGQNIDTRRAQDEHTGKKLSHGGISKNRGEPG